MTSIQRWTKSPLLVGSWILPFVLFAGLTATLLLLVRRHSLWWDEGITREVIDRPFTDLVRFLLTTNGSETSQPLYYLLMWAQASVFGLDEIALRIPSVIMVALAAMIVGNAYGLAGGSVLSARWASVGFLSLPVVLWYALEARPYALILLLSSWLALGLISLSRGRNFPIPLLALVAGLVALSYAIAGIGALLALVLYFFATRDRRKEFMQQPLPSKVALALSAIFIVVFTLFTLSKRSVANVPTGRDTLPTLLYSGYELVLGRTIAWSTGELRESSLQELAQPGLDLAVVILGGMFALALTIATAWALTKKDSRHGEILPLVAMPFISVLFLLYAVVTGFPVLGRHLLFGLPAVFVLVGIALARVGPRAARVGVVGVLILGALSLYGIGFNDRYLKQDFRTASQIISSCLAGSEPAVIFVWAPGPPFSAYLSPDEIDQVTFFGLGSSSVSDEILSNEEPGVFLFETGYFDPHRNLFSSVIDARDSIDLSLPGLLVSIDRSATSCLTED